MFMEKSAHGLNSRSRMPIKTAEKEGATRAALPEGRLLRGRVQGAVAGETTMKWGVSQQ